MVVLLEDLHWADSASLESLEALAQAPGGGPLLVLATARPTLLEERPTWGRTGRCTPGCSSSRCPRTTPAAWSPRSCSAPTTCRRPWWSLVVDTADGNPYYVEELVKWLVEEGVVDTTADTLAGGGAGRRTVRVPTTLRGLLQARLDALEVAERTVIGGAAVVRPDLLGPGRGPARHGARRTRPGHRARRASPSGR